MHPGLLIFKGPRGFDSSVRKPRSHQASTVVVDYAACFSSSRLPYDSCMTPGPRRRLCTVHAESKYSSFMITQGQPAKAPASRFGLVATDFFQHLVRALQFTLIQSS